MPLRPYMAWNLFIQHRFVKLFYSTVGTVLGCETNETTVKMFEGLIALRGSDSSKRTLKQNGPGRLLVFRRMANAAFSNSRRFSEFERTESCQQPLGAKSQYAECFKGWDAFVEQHLWAMNSSAMP
jgi:hypothetical protein